jgi:hypothetical protein
MNPHVKVKLGGKVNLYNNDSPLSPQVNKVSNYSKKYFKDGASFKAENISTASSAKKSKCTESMNSPYVQNAAFSKSLGNGIQSKDLKSLINLKISSCDIEEKKRLYSKTYAAKLESHSKIINHRRKNTYQLDLNEKSLETGKVEFLHKPRGQTPGKNKFNLICRN